MSRTFAMPHDAMSPSLARRCVEQFATEQMFHGTTTSLAIVVSELVSNAVLHGAEPVELTLLFHEGEVTIEVADGGPQINTELLRAGDPPGMGGRGLHIVASLSDRWGTRRTQTGKTVWATLSSAHA